MKDPYNSLTLHEELVIAGLEIEGCSSKGRIDWKKPPTKAQLSKAEGVLTAHDPEKKPQKEARMEELRAKRRAGKDLTAKEQQELLDKLLGI